jgi:putative multiple sugar transport system substrate-binding protein
LSIKNGEQYMTVFKDTAKLAEAAIILGDQILKKVKANAIAVPNAVLAAGALKEIGQTSPSNPKNGKYVTTYLLDPVAVTKDNILVPVDAGFYTDAEAAQIRQ